MGMFNWQAPKGAAVLSSRFWIYWAITGPLTLLVFAIWFFWLRTHRKHDWYKLDLGGPVRAGIGQAPTAAPKGRHDGPWYRKKWIPFQAKDEEKQPVEEAASANNSLAPSPPESTSITRAPTMQVLRADTAIQGPRR